MEKTMRECLLNMKRLKLYLNINSINNDRKKFNYYNR